MLMIVIMVADHVKDINHIKHSADTQNVLVINQLDTQFFFLYVYFNSLHVSSNPVLIIRTVNCINKTSGMSLCVGDRLVCRSGRNFLPDLHTRRSPTQSDIYQMSY